MGIALLVALLSAASVQTRATHERLEVPFTLHRDHLLVVRGAIGDRQDLVFIVDTGAGRTLVSSSVAAALGIRGPSTQLSSFGTRTEAEEIEIPSLQVGRYRLDRLRVLATPLDAAARALGLDRLDGLIGIDALRRRSFVIDYRTRSLWIGQTRAARHTTAIVEDPFFVRVRAEVDDQPVHLIADSGASHLVLFETRRSLDAERPEEGAHVAGLTAVRPVRVDRLRIGKWTTHALVALAVPKGPDEPAAVDGLLSLRTLGADFVQFDFEKQEIGWRHP